MALSNFGGNSSLFQNSDCCLAFSDLRRNRHRDGAIAPYLMASSGLPHKFELMVLQEFLDLTFKPRHQLRCGAIRGVTHDETGTSRYQCPL